MTKLKLSFYTNIPTPYQDDFFSALSALTDFSAVFYSKSEKDRFWNLEPVDYHRTFLRNNLLTGIMQYWFKDFHFSFQIFKQSFTEKAEWVILGGNYFALNNFFAALILKSRGIKLAFFTEPTKSTSGLKRWFKKVYLKLFLSRIDLMMYIGKGAQKSFEELGFVNKNFILIPYNINTQRFNRADLDNKKLEQIESELELKNKLVILTSGTLSHRKGIDIALKVISKINLKYNNQIAFLVLGQGELEHEMKSKYTASNIHFLGFVQRGKIPYYFTVADIFLFCSRYDGWGLVINEAIAANLAVVVSDTVGASELIESGRNGFVVPNEAIQTFVDSIEQLLQEYNLLEVMQAENRNLMYQISSDYCSKRLVNHIMEMR